MKPFTPPLTLHPAEKVYRPRLNAIQSPAMLPNANTGGQHLIQRLHRKREYRHDNGADYVLAEFIHFLILNFRSFLYV